MQDRLSPASGADLEDIEPVMKYLVIGYGNTLRCDDGAGYYVAEQIAEWGLENVRSRPCHQLTPELADEMAQADTVIFVDAIAPSAPQPAEITLQPLQDDEPSTTVNLGHGLNPRSLLAMTHSLYGRQPRAYGVLIPTEQFDFGDQISTTTQRGIETATQRMRQFIVQE